MKPNIKLLRALVDFNKAVEMQVKAKDEINKRCDEVNNKLQKSLELCKS